MELDNLLSRLENVKKSGSGHTARCPGHEDNKNSLGISVGDNGYILLKCYAGCEFGDIVKSLGLEPSDFMPEKTRTNNETVYKIHIPPDTIVEHIRVDEPGGKRFFWRKNGQTGLGGLKVRDLPLFEPLGNSPPKTKSTFITEGEKASIAAARLGCKAFGTVCGASSCPSRESLEVLKGEDVILWADNDEPGQKHMENIRDQLNELAKSVIIITTGGPKEDAADFKGSLYDLKSIIDKASGVRSANLIADSVDAAINSLARYCNNDTSDRVPTGLNKLDQALRGGMMQGALYLLGAPSGHGKTTLLQCIAVNCARARGPVLFVSPEMSGAELAEREVVRVSGISVNEIAPWKHPNDKIPKLAQIEEVAKNIKKERIPIHIVDDTDITMVEIGKLAERIENIKLVIVDYAQEIANRSTTSARYLAVGEVGKDAIVLGKTLGVPVLVASQVNVNKDGGDLEYAFRETKDLEHRAHCSMIMEVKRSKMPNKYGYYDIESARVFARKNRSGAVFSVDLDYNPALFTIGNKTTDMERGY